MKTIKPTMLHEVYKVQSSEVYSDQKTLIGKFTTEEHAHMFKSLMYTVEMDRTVSFIVEDLTEEKK